jgi:hypothetical protein
MSFGITTPLELPIALTATCIDALVWSRGFDFLFIVITIL